MERYKRFPSGIIIDTRTGLEWYLGPWRDMTWDEANSWAKYLNFEGGGWHLPSRAELKGIYTDNAQYGADPIFKLTGYKWFWSNELDGSSDAWRVRFRHGIEAAGDRGNPGGKRVLAVRRKSPEWLSLL